ncbi:MAG: ArsR family transcriptional regulator [Gulosibacter sp.]|uniref:arsenate reductase/protein-tyrosine-phosphatase family protein n=1 Tax=Gulosibacter sp. TaxID=2817531 RepID=UPI003F8F5E45
MQIVDLLAIGDRSPGELQAEIGVSSNLLAHHLRVLDAEGIVTRNRSEGDGRRFYVRLMPDTLISHAPVPKLPARRIVFICTGNSARSPLAAAYWSTVSRIPATSAGTHPSGHTSPKAIVIANRHGLDLTGHTPQRISSICLEGDLVVTLCDRAREELALTSALHWSIPNPGKIGTTQAYEAAFREIRRRAAVLDTYYSTTQ